MKKKEREIKNRIEYLKRHANEKLANVNCLTNERTNEQQSKRIRIRKNEIRKIIFKI